ncbi:MAG: hypothetical protein OXJ55_13630 [Caldilineaceae bacterium]|nr:hypothetical protein [Caldilineaceae bacterium]MDE0461666.1 hypothetical protein [Caldilineaceae bacterium]
MALTLTNHEKKLAGKLAKQLEKTKWYDTTVVCQLFSIEHARDLEETNLGDFAIEAKMLILKSKSDTHSPNVNTIETTLRQGIKLAQWGVRMPDPWEQRLTALTREMEAIKIETE